jgi:hypothetical protein
MALRIRYDDVSDLTGVQAVSVELSAGPHLRIGYVRNDPLGTWMARLRPGVQAPGGEGVQAFPTRREAAMWLLVAGGFAQPGVAV